MKLLIKSFHLFTIKEILFRCFCGRALLFGNESFMLTAYYHFQIICFTKELKASQLSSHRFLLTALVTLTSFNLFLHSFSVQTIPSAFQFLALTRTPCSEKSLTIKYLVFLHFHLSQILQWGRDFLMPNYYCLAKHFLWNQLIVLICLALQTFISSSICFSWISRQILFPDFAVSHCYSSLHQTHRWKRDRSPFKSASYAFTTDFGFARHTFISRISSRRRHLLF